MLMIETFMKIIGSEVEFFQQLSKEKKNPRKK